MFIKTVDIVTKLGNMFTKNVNIDIITAKKVSISRKLKKFEKHLRQIRKVLLNFILYNLDP